MRLFAATSLWVAAFALVAASAPPVARGIEASRLLGPWKGQRRGLEVIWNIHDDGRMRLEERNATWSVQHDTLLVEFDPLGESGMTERAVYRILLSNPRSAQRRMFVRGFDLGVAGLLLTQDAQSAGVESDSPEDAPEPVRTHDTDEHPEHQDEK